ncbi:MAG: hypothetical protein IPL53_19430 [Ignavibacteria bacterium]|nr:hypothetical protein [Ignavibacteria bacterium]
MIIFQILDPMELTFSGKSCNTKDMETNEEMYFPAGRYAENHIRESIQEFIEKYKNECMKNNIEFVTLSTSTSFDTALLRYLNKRKNLSENS